jgi:hypothetical protein
MSERAAPRLRARVREALVCPYCRDAVARKGTVACARRGCGALYHRECWEDCQEHYGGCAVLGCESRHARGISLAGYFWKLLRLVLAALLLPPRVLRAVARDDALTAGERASLATRALDYAKRLDPRHVKREDMLVCAALYAVTLPALIALLIGSADAIDSLAKGAAAETRTAVAFVLRGLFLAYLGVAVFMPIPLGFLLALGFNATKFLARVFRAEIASLGRADAGGVTVIARLRAGAGRKPETA